MSLYDFTDVPKVEKNKDSPIIMKFKMKNEFEQKLPPNGHYIEEDWKMAIFDGRFYRRSVYVPITKDEYDDLIKYKSTECFSGKDVYSAHETCYHVNYTK